MTYRIWPCGEACTLQSREIGERHSSLRYERQRVPGELAPVTSLRGTR
jgi:hypothetical protein